MRSISLVLNRRALLCAATLATAASASGCADDFGAPGGERVSESAAAVRSDPRPTAAGVGADFFVALQPDGTVKTWGKNNYGQLGNNSTTPTLTPQFVLFDDPATGPTTLVPIHNVVSVAVGSVHAFALRSDGTVWGWGYNQFHVLGNTGLNYQAMPVAEPVKTINNSVLGNVTAVAAGSYHTLALTSTGSVWSWGLGEHGELGNNSPSLTPQTRAVKIDGLSGVVDIAAGGQFSIALTGSGDVYTFGWNNRGQLAQNNGGASIAVPTLVPTLQDIKDVAAGNAFGLAVDEVGNVLAWGQGDDGQLGRGVSQADDPIPGTVNNVHNAVAVSAGIGHGLALDVNGKVYGWGRNNAGQSGDGTQNQKPTPAPVKTGTIINNSDLVDIVSISAGRYHSVATSSTGKVFTWGENDDGELAGDNTLVRRYATPIFSGATTPKSGFTSITAGRRHTLALRTSGRLFAWGRGNDGRLGLAEGDDAHRATPTELQLLDNVRAIAAGGAHSLAVTESGELYAWGDGTYGQTGLGATGVDAEIPLPVRDINDQFLKDIAAVSGGTFFSVALKSDGTVWTFGANNEGQLGAGTTPRDRADQVTIADPIIDVAACDTHVLALSSSGEVWSWGSDAFGKLGRAGNATPPARVLGEGGSGFLGNIKAIDCGSDHSLAVTQDGNVYAWGSNSYGQLGSPGGQADTPRKVLIAVSTPLQNVKAIAASDYSSFALVGGGTIQAWGYNGSGALGINSGSGSTVTPTPVVTSDGNALNLVKAIARGGNAHAVAIKGDNTIWSWGINSYGQLGQGNLGAPVLFAAQVTTPANADW